MAHDETKVLMGGVKSSNRQVSWKDADPAQFVAGLAARLKSDDTLSLTKADGKWLGITLGKNLSDVVKGVPLARKGLGVPVLLEAAPARIVVTIDSYANLVDTGDDTLKIGATTFTFKASASTEDQVAAATSNEATASALASKINAHSVAGLLFIAVAVGDEVTITAKNNATLGASIDCVYTDAGTETVGLSVEDDEITFLGGGISPDYVVKGEKVYFSDTTGKADDPNSGSTISAAVYASGVLTGINEAGQEVYAALIDMPGGL